MKVDLLLSTLLVLVGVGVSSKSRDCLGFTPEKLTQTPLTRDQRISPEIIIQISHTFEGFVKLKLNITFPGRGVSFDDWNSLIFV